MIHIESIRLIINHLIMIALGILALAFLLPTFIRDTKELIKDLRDELRGHHTQNP